MSRKTLKNAGDTYEAHSLYDRWLHIRTNAGARARSASTTAAAPGTSSRGYPGITGQTCHDGYRGAGASTHDAADARYDGAWGHDAATAPRMAEPAAQTQ